MSQRRNFQKYNSQLYSHAADVVHKHRELDLLEQMLAHPQAKTHDNSILNRLKRLKENIKSFMVPKNKQNFDSLGTSDIRNLPIVNNSMQQQKVAATHRDALRLIERTEPKIPQNTQANFNSQADKLEDRLKGMDHLGKGDENEEVLKGMLEELQMTTTSIPKKKVLQMKKKREIPDLPDDIFKNDPIDGGRRNPKKKPTKKPTKLNRGADMNMKDIRGLCKVNQIKLSKTKDGVRVIYTKKELITKLKRKKIL